MEKHLVKTAPLIAEKTNLGISDGPSLPTTFKAAGIHPNWDADIDREYKALIKWKTWTYIRNSPEMQTVPFKSTFWAKQVDDSGELFLLKARSVLRGDLQESYQFFAPENGYDPEASHKSFCLYLAIAAADMTFWKAQV